MATNSGDYTDYFPCLKRQGESTAKSHRGYPKKQNWWQKFKDFMF